MAHDFILYLRDKLFSFAGWLTKGKHWALKVTFLALALSLSSSFPRREIILNDYNHSDICGIQKKIEAPFSAVDAAPGTHDAKLTFRLTVPLLAYFLGLGVGGCKILEVLVGIALFYIIARLSENIAGDRICSAFIVLFSASIFVGTTSFIDFRAVYDGIAIFFLVAALLFRNPFIIGLLVFASAWTDERGLIASSLVWFYYASIKGFDFKSIFKNSFSLRVMAIYCAWGLYFAGRFYLAFRLDLKTDFEGTMLFFEQFNTFAAALWTALEGGWLLVALSLIVLLMKRNYFASVVYVFFLFVIAFVAMSVFDITRSMAYMFPVIFIALRILKESEDIQVLKEYCLLIFVISFLWPSYYVGGHEYIWWHAPPFPIQFVRSFILNL